MEIPGWNIITSGMFLAPFGTSLDTTLDNKNIMISINLYNIQKLGKNSDFMDLAKHTVIFEANIYNAFKAAVNKDINSLFRKTKKYEELKTNFPLSEEKFREFLGTDTWVEITAVVVNRSDGLNLKILKMFSGHGFSKSFLENFLEGKRNEKNVSAQENQGKTQTWVSGPNENQRWTECYQKPPS